MEACAGTKPHAVIHASVHDSVHAVIHAPFSRCYSRLTFLAPVGEVSSELPFEEVRRRLESAQMAVLHEHDRRLDADARPRDSLQPPALRMRGEKARREKAEADPARHERQLHVDVVDLGGDLERSAELAELRLE